MASRQDFPATPPAIELDYAAATLSLPVLPIPGTISVGGDPGACYAAGQPL